MSIRLKLAVGFTSALLLLAGITFVSEHRLEQSRDDGMWVAHTHEVLAELQGLSVALYSAESDKRGYLLTGAPELCAGFHDAQEQVTIRFRRLRALTHDNARQQRRLGCLRPLLIRILTAAERTIAGRQKNTTELSAAYSLAFANDQELTLQIQKYQEQMTTEEQDLLRGRSRASQASSNRLGTIVELGAVLNVMIVSLSMLAIIRERQRREKAETALREMQESLEARVRERTANLSSMGARYRLLFEDSPLPMVVLDVETHCFLAVNTAIEELYGYSRQELLSMTLSDTQPMWEGSPLMNFNMIDAAYACTMTFVSRRKDGKLLTIEARIRTVDFGDRRAQLALFRDVTEQKRLETQLQQSQKMEAIGRLAGGIAHDFNNLLTVILGYSDLILRKLDGNHPLRSKVSEIQAAGQRAANLTAQLLAFSHKQVLKLQIFNFNTVVSGKCEMLQRLLGENIEISLHLDPDLGQIRADPSQLEQVLVNLAVNARDAMPKGGQLVIETRNRELDRNSAPLVGVPPGRYVVLEVSDTGCGMNEATKIRVFEPFFTTKDVGKGTGGLGLSTVLGVAQQSGGTVIIYSELGHGTTFSVYLPRLDDVDDEQPRQSKALAHEIGGTILLVEDEDGVRAWAAEVLREAGCDVLEASNGPEALRMAEDCLHAPALLLTDVIMPEMGGAELAESLQCKWPGLPVVYASGYSKHAVPGCCAPEQSVQFLQKPYTAAALLERVARAQPVH